MTICTGIVIIGGDPKAGTQLEQLVQKLMESEGDTGNQSTSLVIHVN